MTPTTPDTALSVCFVSPHNGDDATLSAHPDAAAAEYAAFVAQGVALALPIPAAALRVAVLCVLCGRRDADETGEVVAALVPRSASLDELGEPLAVLAARLCAQLGEPPRGGRASFFDLASLDDHGVAVELAVEELPLPPAPAPAAH